MDRYKDGSRIPHRRGHQPSRGMYEFAKFSEKLHEIEKMSGLLGHPGVPPSRAPTKSATEIVLLSHTIISIIQYTEL